MADRPIIFSAPMVRALLAGRKTQTRRLIKPAPFIDNMGNFCAADRKGTIWNWGQNFDGSPCLRNFIRKHVHYAVGDRLYVRESIRFWAVPSDDAELSYLADGTHRQLGPITGDVPDEALAGYFKMVDRSQELRGAISRPSIHMPRWASRLTLIVEAVRVERLQDISRDDAIAEGIERVGGGMLRWENWSGAEGQSGTSPEAAYALLWNSLHGDGAWDANPWVVALTFRVIAGNIDRIAS